MHVLSRLATLRIQVVLLGLALFSSGQGSVSARETLADDRVSQVAACSTRSVPDVAENARVEADSAHNQERSCGSPRIALDHSPPRIAFAAPGAPRHAAAATPACVPISLRTLEVRLQL